MSRPRPPTFEAVVEDLGYDPDEPEVPLSLEEMIAASHEGQRGT